MEENDNILGMSDEDFIDNSSSDLDTSSNDSNDSYDQDDGYNLQSDKNNTNIQDNGVSDPEDIDYKGWYDKVMAPIKANGKTITLQSPEEAIQLMQMGANYTKKMQQIAPQRKTLMMLEKNGIDQDTLNFLIDIKNKNPQAIAKLLKDANIDPLDVDTTSQNNYVAPNYSISDQEADWTSAINELKSNPESLETLKQINSWDTESINQLAQEPNTLYELDKQRQEGTYDYIMQEIDRAKTLGYIDPNMPMLQAYLEVGSNLARQMEARSQPVGYGTGSPMPTNNARAKQASISRSNGRSSQQVSNPLSMSDEDFEKYFSN